MANATVLRTGQNNSSGDALANYLKVFSGEVLVAYDQATMMKDLQMMKNISSGRSSQFPVTDLVNSSYHTVGAEIVGQASPSSERVISIDDLLISDIFLANIDEAMAHWDTRSVYSAEVGRALGRQFDQNSFQVVTLAAKASATVTGGNGGTVDVTAGYANNGATIAAGIFSAAQAFDEKNLPEDDRYAALRPAQYYLVAQTTNVINRDWGGMGVYAEGSVLKVAGMHILKSNHVPSTNVTTGPTAYQGDFRNTQGICFTKAAMGTVKLMDLAIDVEYDARRQGTLLVAKYALGHGILRPECAYELASA